MTGESICYAIVFVAEDLIAWLYFEYLFSRKRSVQLTALCFTLCYICLYALSFLDSIAANASAFFVLNTVIVVLCYRCEVKTAVLHSAFMTFTMVVTEVLTALILNFIVHDYAAYTYSMPVLVTLSVFSKLLYFLITVVGSRVFGPHKVGSREPTMLLMLCTVPLTSMIIAFTITYIGITAKLSREAELLMSLSVLALLFVNLLVFIIYNHIQAINDKYMVLQMSSIRDQADAEYYRMMQKQYESQHVLIHDIKNHLSVISALADKENSKAVAGYIADLGTLSEYGHGARLCDEPILNMVLLRYSEYCVSKGITFDCDVRAGGVNFMDAASITALFGNLISNAVEAAELSAERFVELSVIKNSDNNFIVITVVNSCDTAPLTDANGKLKTRKFDKSNHGFGSKSIGQVTQKYRGSSTAYYVENEKRFHNVIRFSNV